MTTAYITKEAGKIRANNNTFLFEGMDGSKTTLFPDKLERMVITGNIGMTGAALSFAASSSTNVFFIKGRRVLGLYSSDYSKDCLTRHRQHLLMEDKDWVVCTAKTIVIGKIKNEKHFIQRLIRSKKIDFDLGRNATIIFNSLLEKVREANSLDCIRGMEGAAAEVYFPLLGENIKQDWISFKKREKYPPKDAVNATLSYLYAILTNRISSLIKIHGLDGSVGSLHCLQYGRDSLSCDLIEEFRTPIVDQLVCSLFNLGQLKEDDFLIEDNGVYLDERGKRIVISAFERKLSQEHQYPLKNKTLSYGKIIEEQILQYKHYINGVSNTYIPFEVK